MAAKELLNDIKYDRKLARVAAGEDAVDWDEANLEDWEFRNYRDDWVPSYEKIRVKLVSHFKEMKYHKSSSQDDSSEKKSVPALLTKALLSKAVKAFLAPGFGQAPRIIHQDSSSNNNNEETQPKYWGCGLMGHKFGDAVCKADPGAVHISAPAKAKRKCNNEDVSDGDGGPNNKKDKGVCQY